MAFKKVELDEEDLSSGGRAFERFNAIGENHLGVWLRTEQQTKTFRQGEPAKTVNIHVFWRPANPAKPDKPEGEFEITGSWGMDKAIEKAKKAVNEGGLGLRDNAGHLVRLTYTKNLPTNNGDARLFTVEADTEYPSNPKAKLPPGFKGGANAAPPDDDIPF